jgi:aminoglycoside 3-N-acetyltransferase
VSPSLVVGVDSLADDLRALGIILGCSVLVHSSLRSVGTVERGAEGLVDALLAAVGPEGTVMVPTFTYDSARFDPGATPGRTGAVAEALRRRAGAVRSLHPFHSVAAFGPLGAELTRGHELLPGTGIGSPLDRLAAADGMILLLGVGHDRSTTIHVGEFHAEAFYLDIPFDPTWPTAAEIVTGDETRRVSYDRFPGCSRSFAVIEPHLRACRAIGDGLVGRADAQLVVGAAVIEESVALLARDEAALLCADPDCYRCSRAHARLGRRAP